MINEKLQALSDESQAIASYKIILAILSQGKFSNYADLAEILAAKELIERTAIMSVVLPADKDE